MGVFRQVNHSERHLEKNGSHSAGFLSLIPLHEIFVALVTNHSTVLNLRIVAEVFFHFGFSVGVGPRWNKRCIAAPTGDWGLRHSAGFPASPQ